MIATWDGEPVSHLLINYIFFNTPNKTSKMKKTIIMAIAILLVSTVTFAQTKQNSTHKSASHQHKMTTSKKYTCTMHPEVVMNKPGKCPKCGMNLVAMKKKTEKKDKSMGNMKM